MKTKNIFLASLLMNMIVTNLIAGDGPSGGNPVLPKSDNKSECQENTDICRVEKTIIKKKCHKNRVGHNKKLNKVC